MLLFFIVVIILIVMLIDRLYEVLFNLVVVIVIKEAMLDLETIPSFVSSVGLSMVDTVLGLICVDVEMLMLFIRVVAVYVTHFTTVESVM